MFLVGISLSPGLLVQFVSTVPSFLFPRYVFLYIYKHRLFRPFCRRRRHLAHLPTSLSLIPTHTHTQYRQNR